MKHMNIHMSAPVPKSWRQNDSKSISRWMQKMNISLKNTTMEANTIRANQILLRLEHAIRNNNISAIKRYKSQGWGEVNWDTAKKHLRDKWEELLDLANERLTPISHEQK